MYKVGHGILTFGKIEDYTYVFWEENKIKSEWKGDIDCFEKLFSNDVHLS